MDIDWSILIAYNKNNAGVAELVDAPDLGSGAARRGGSNPLTRTKLFSINVSNDIGPRGGIGRRDGLRGD